MSNVEVEEETRRGGGMGFREEDDHRAVPVRYSIFSSPPRLLTAAVLALSVVPAAAQDRVHVAGSTGGKRVMAGRVLEYTGRALEFQHPGGRRETVPGEMVLQVETQHVKTHQEADAAFAQQRFQEALALYARAGNEEPRTWVRRHILAQKVRCYRAMDRLDLAGSEFLLLVQSDPATPYFDCIPLAWVPEQPSPALEQTARGWLGREEPAAALLGASHLLGTGVRAQALARLRQLATAPDRRIALLATAQQWRAAVTTVDAAQLDAWERTIAQMPEPLRAGPWFVLGLARVGARQWDEAALALLQAPILYPDDRRLAAAALVEAGRALGQLGRPRQAARLYREVLQSYPERDRAVAEARHRLQALSRE
jgi:tetratricopeptide (TPR) repeat protein